MEENEKETNAIELEKAVDALPQNGAGSEEAVAQVTAADAVADIAQPTAEEIASASQESAVEKLPAPHCPFCQVALFTDKSGVTKYNIQMGDERIRIFTCANCDCVLPIQVMMIDTPMIAAPGPTGGRLLKM